MSRKKTVNLLEDENSLLICCHISKGELLPALNCRSFTVTKPLSEKPYFVKYSVPFDAYYMLATMCLYESTDGITFNVKGTLNYLKSYFLEFYNSNGDACYTAYNEKRGVMYDGKTLSLPTSGVTRMSCAVMHCGRAFFAPVEDKLSVGWSAPCDLMSVDESLDNGGWVKLDPQRGEVIDLIEYGEKLVAVREYGLTVISAMGSPENYKAEITDTDTDRIYANTARALGGKIIFCTTSGIYSFNGSQIKKLPFRYEDEVVTVLCAAAYAGKYYINCSVKTLNMGAIIYYDIDDGDSYLMPVELAEAGSLCVGKDLRVYNDTRSYYVEDTVKYEIRSGEINFGSRKTKTVTEIYVDGVADVEISNGSVTRRFEGAKGKIRPHLRGESFTFTLTAGISKSPSIGAFTATAEVCDAI